jgi:hypothetical protein
MSQESNYTLHSSVDTVPLYTPDYINVVEGEGVQLAAASTTMSVLFIFHMMFLYNCCTFKITRVQRKVLVTVWDVIFANFYALLVIVFELQVVYGSAMAETRGGNKVQPPTFITMVAWISANSLSQAPLLMAYCSKARYRAFLWVPFCFHLVGMTIIFGEMVSRPRLGPELLIIPLMAALSLVAVFKVPYAFHIDAGRFNYEERLQQHSGSTRLKHVHDTVELISETRSTNQ